MNTIFYGTNSPTLTNTCYAFTPPLHCYASSPPPGCVPLSTIIESFEGSVENDRIYLRWKSSEERGIKYYHLERSGDLQKWEPLGSLAALGQPSHYELKDENLPPGYASLYYRLRVEDEKGGELMYGPIEVVLSASRAALPQSSIVRVGESLRLRLNTGEEIRVILYDAQGRRSFEGYYNGPGEAEIPAVFFSKGFNLLLIQVIGGEIAAYRVLGL
ncbi:MAG: hypothetical protein NZ933_02995 [Bacteroidia bacterium]|nr:hypothetical protein [Bacteroidia bacterium]